MYLQHFERTLSKIIPFLILNFIFAQIFEGRLKLLRSKQEQE